MNLGIFLELRSVDDIERKTRIACEAGYDGIQLYPPTLELGDADLSALVEACETNNLAVPVISAYCDLLKPEAAPMGFTLTQAEELIDWMQPLGATNFVVWSGTLAPDLLGAHPDNRSDAAWKTIVANAKRLLDRLAPISGTLVIEPYYTHLAGDIEACLRLVNEVNHPALKFVLDPPNMIPPERFVDQRDEMRKMVNALAPHIGLVHFKDARLTSEGEYDFPGPGQGDLDYSVYMQKLKEIGYEGWGIVEHVCTEKMTSALEHILVWI